MRAFIGLGGNLPGTRAAMESAAAELGTIGQVVRASSLYRSAARDLIDQPDFTNAALELETDLEPVDILFALKRLELTLGRDPQGIRFGPRLIDLDILAFDGRCMADAELELIVPHPRLVEVGLFARAVGGGGSRGCARGGGATTLRVDVAVVDLLPSVADQEVVRIAGSEWAD